MEIILIAFAATLAEFAIAATVAECAVAPIGRQLGYLFCYKKNIDYLNAKIVELINVKERLQHEVEEAQRNGEVIYDDVTDWVTKVDNITGEHRNFTRRVQQANTKFSCEPQFPNLVQRRRLSRRAKKMAEKVAAQIQDREKLKTVSYRPPPPNSVFITLKEKIVKGYEWTYSIVIAFYS